MDFKNYKYIWRDDNWWKYNKIPCDLCNTLIRYEFELQNINNENDIIKVWCECIKKIDPTLFKILDADKRKFLKNKKIENVLNILIELTRFNTKFDYNDTIKYFEDRWWFTPRQLLVIYKDITKYKINFNFLDFKVIVIRNREKQQIVNLNYNEKIVLSKFLTKRQKERFNLL